MTKTQILLIIKVTITLGVFGTKKNIIKTISLVFVACILLNTIIITEASAKSFPSASEYNQLVDEYATKIWNNYSVRVKYPIRTDGYYAVGTSSLMILEQSLELVTKEFMQQLSKYYKDTYGDYITCEFVYLNDRQNTDIAALGFFSSKSSTIELYLPVAGSGSVMSGCSPFTILHEFGHAYHLFLKNKYGTDAILGSWNKTSLPLYYDENRTKNPDKTIFATVYASKTYEEDFAETFAYAFCSNRNGLGIGDRLYSKNGAYTGLGQKIRFIERSVGQFFESAEQVQTKLYNIKLSAVSLKYENLTLSGNSLEYIGFPPPHGVLENVLTALKIQPVETRWVSEVGGWKVWDNTGGVYLLFPGAKYVTIKIPVRKSNESPKNEGRK